MMWTAWQSTVPSAVAPGQTARSTLLNSTWTRHCADSAFSYDDQYSRVGTVPSAVAPGQPLSSGVAVEFDPALPRSVLCLLGIGLEIK